MNNIIEKELNTGLNNPINNNTNTAVSPQCEEDYEVIDAKIKILNSTLPSHSGIYFYINGI